MAETTRKSADKPDATDVATEKATQPDSSEPTFTVGRLISEASALGLRSADVAGAFDGVADTKEVTVKDAKARVSAWLKAEVQTEG